MRQKSISVSGHTVVCDIVGEGEETLLCLNGGPGLSCDYMLSGHTALAGKGLQVVSFDQLGTGRSDRPEDDSLWSIERYVEEVETVRTALGLGKVHLAGHSWGGWLAVEYAVTHPENLASLILENTCADIPHLIGELHRLRAALGPEAVTMMAAHEARGDFQHPEYQAAITLLNHRHVCRLREWPEPVKRSLSTSNRHIYNLMQGPNEFHYIGNLKDWRRLDELRAVDVPALIVVGRHDEITPNCARLMKEAMPHARLEVFEASAHMPFHEEPERFLQVMRDFLDATISRQQEPQPSLSTA
ncbi:proline iminopeptidase-family hydrolase [Nitratireductor pacificus]|uniref:Proline-specific peptidase n=1 Tax=Nitratireductor pacificus pht-3B TaxID=391937 RepID=K2M8Z6_9HYPH|nr:proline iminopeptidase-family hydrolase [Nitratireductor pacificus]EKF17505.1 proline-specific peptidase [Nitratireductor pacificus pht-3B]